MITTILSSPFVHALGWTLVHSLWQITIVGIVLWILLKFFSNRSAQLDYWFSVSALLFICFWIGFTFLENGESSNFTSINSSIEETITPLDFTTSNTITESTSIINDIPKVQKEVESPFSFESLFPWFTAFWMLGVLIFGIRFTLGWRNMLRFKKTKIPFSSVDWQNQVDNLSKQLGIKYDVKIFLSEKINSPVTFGHFKPIILFPASMVTGLTALQIEMLILHELAHIRRSDFLINILQSFVEIILFYHPLLWWISNQIRTSREHCCDDIALSITNDRMLYAETLTQLKISIFSQMPQHQAFQKSLAMSATGKNNSFTYRIQRLFQQNNYKPSMTKSIFSFSLVGFCFLVLAFQNSFLQQKNYENYVTEGMMFIITPEKIELELREAKHQFNKINVRLEHQLHYPQLNHQLQVGDSINFESYHSKIIMPDKSFFQVDGDALDYMAISVDWAQQQPLSAIAHGKGNICTSTIRGENGTSQVNFLQNNSPLSFGEITLKNHLSTEHLYHFFLEKTENQSTLILDGTEISPSKFSSASYNVLDIFSIKKLISPKGNHIVYEMTSRLKSKQDLKLVDSKSDCLRNIQFGDFILETGMMRSKISNNDFLKIKDQPLIMDYCGILYEIISFSISSQNPHTSIRVEDYREDYWKKRVVEYLSSHPQDNLITFDRIYTTQGSVKPFSLSIGDFWEKGNKSTREGYRSVIYNPKAAYFQDMPNGSSTNAELSTSNFEFYLNEEKLENPNLKRYPYQLRNLKTIDSIIYLQGNSVKEYLPNAQKDSVYLVYSNFQRKEEKGLQITCQNGIRITPIDSLGTGNLKLTIHEGPVKIMNDKPFDKDFKPSLFFINNQRLDIPFGKRLPIEVEELTIVDSIIILKGTEATKRYGEAGKNDVWLIYTSPVENNLSLDFEENENSPKLNVKEKEAFEQSIQVYPNPVIDEVAISFDLEDKKKTIVQIFNQNGQLIETIHNGLASTNVGKEGKHVEGYFWRPTNIPAGIYFVKIQVDSETFTKKIIKAKD